MQEFIDMVMDAVFMIYRNRQLIPCVYGAIIIRKERCWIKARDVELREYYLNNDERRMES